MAIHAIKKSDLWKLLPILLIAALLRFGDAGTLSHFRYDQATLSQKVLDMVHGVSFPLVGISSSVHVPNSPMTVYVLALPYFFSDNPLVTIGFIALLNVIGVALLWLIAHRYFGPSVALIAALMYAVNPYAVGYSRSIWAQDYHTPIILFAILLGFLGFLEKRKWAQILFLPVFCIGLQIHFAAWTLLPIFLFFLWLGRKNIYWLGFVISIVLAFLILIPFAIGLSQAPEDASNRADTIVSILQHGVNLRTDSLQQITELATGLPAHTRVDKSSVYTVQAFVPIIKPFWWGMGILTLLGLIGSLKQRWRHFAPLLWLWSILTVIVFIPAWTGSGVYLHYFIPSIPALSLLAAIGLLSCIEFLETTFKNKGTIRNALYLLFGLTVLNQAAFVVDSYRLAENYIVSNQQTTTPLHYLMDVREALQPYKDVIILGANPHESNFYVWTPMLYNTASCVRDLLINGGGIDILPDHPFAALVAPLAPINADYVVPERYKNSNPQIIPLRPGEDPYIIYSFDKAPEWTETPIVDIDPVQFETGIQLTGYYITDNWMQLRWKVQELTGLSFQYYGHFLNAAGEKIGQRDAPFYVGQQWCEGDTLITTIDIQLPPETVTLRVGLYSLKEGGGTQSYNITNPKSQEGALWVDIPLKHESS